VGLAFHFAYVSGLVLGHERLKHNFGIHFLGFLTMIFQVHWLYSVYGRMVM